MQPAPAAEPPRTLVWSHWGRIGYAEAMERQAAAWQALVDGWGQHRLFTLEHEPVITMGRRAAPTDLLLSEEALRARGIDLAVSDRGGEVTYHGPGQLVLYAVVDTRALRLGPSDLVRALASSVSDYLASLGISAPYDTAHPGLWTAQGKLVAVGMRISRGVSMHGAALNLATSLDAFSLFVPCGMPGAAATSVAALRGEAPPLAEAAEACARRFADALQLTLSPDGPR